MFKHTLLLSAALLSAQTALATSVRPESDFVEVTAMRIIDADDATSTITVLTEGELAIRNTPYVADQLRAVPGVALSRSGAVGGLTQIRMRGAEANHTLVLLNGAEVSDPVTGETDFGLLSGLGLSHIVVARGEQSVLHGSDAIGGVVALETKTSGLQGAVEYGAFDTKRGHIAYGERYHNKNYELAASFFETDGVDTAGLGGEKDGSDSFSLLGGGEFEITPDWTLGGFASYRQSSVETDPDLNFDGALDNADRVSNSDQWVLSGNVSGETGRVSHELRANVGETVRESKADGAFTDETTGQRTKLSYSPSILFGYDQPVSIIDDDTPRFWGEYDNYMRISGIIDWESEDYERVDTNTVFGDPNQVRSFDKIGVAAEVRANYNNVLFNASVRHDDNEGRFENATTWRVGGAYKFDYNTKIRASLGSGVKNPTFTELYGFFPASFIGNPNLKPEKSTSWEIGVDHGFGSFAQVSLTYFDAQLENEITTNFTPSFLSTPANLTGKSERSGVEIGVSKYFRNGVSLTGAATKISSENDSGDDEIRVPEFTASAALNWDSQSKDGFRAGLAVDYVGSQDDLNFGTFPAQRVNLDSYALVSASVEYPVLDRLSLTLRGENLLDEKVTDVFGYNGTGAGVFFGFKIR
ncbi:MAG: TonB-dependent receptor plug domain-containing protein [Maricaulaceae bacterium]